MMLPLLSDELLERERERAKRAGDLDELERVEAEQALRLGTRPGSTVRDPSDRREVITIVDTGGGSISPTGGTPSRRREPDLPTSKVIL